MNKKVKTLFTILMVSLVVATFSTNVFALTPGGVQIEDPTNPTIEGTGGQVLGIIRVVGIILSVGILMIIGIKYMMGSAQEKAEYKKVFIPYIIGAALLFAAAVLAEGIYNFFINLH